MKIIGFSSGVVEHESNVDRMLKAIMVETGYETEFVKLNELNYSACKSCGNERPAMPKLPIFNAERRDTPSQKECFDSVSPAIVSIRILPWQ